LTIANNFVRVYKLKLEARMAVLYDTVRSNFKPKVRYISTLRRKKCTLVRYVGTQGRRQKNS